MLIPNCGWLSRDSRLKVDQNKKEKLLDNKQNILFSFFFSSKMVRINGQAAHQVEMGGNGRTGLPSDVFSPNIMQMEKQEKKRSSFFKWFAIVAAVLCIIFMIATVGLAVLLAVKLRQMDEVEMEAQKSTALNETTIPSMGDSVGGGVHEPRLPAEQTGLNWPAPSGSLHAQYKRAAIASDHGLCSEIGRDVMLEGGNSVEATIAALLCIGVVNPQNSGIGGGFLMTLYNATTQRCTTIDARETAPMTATSTMFSKSPKDSVHGYKAIATPGEIHGYWTVFTRYGSGKVSWKRLLQPSIRLAREGFPVSSNLAVVLQQKEDDIDANEDMKRTFVDPRTGRVYEEGDILKRERLAELLDELAVAPDPVQLFYKEGIAQTIAAEIKDNGGYVTVEDLSAYETVIHETPLESEVLPDEMVMCGPPPPSSFTVTQAIIGIMAQFYGNKKVDFNDPMVYHRLIEAEKFSYAQRTKLGDSSFVKNARTVSRNMTKPAFVKWIASLIKDQAQPINYYTSDLSGHVPDHGTSHVTALDHQGHGVSATSTINLLLGSMRVSPTLGVIWNDQMDDFSMPNMSNFFGFAPSPENFILPKKRPMSSMSPMIIYNKNSGKVKMVIGASGGSRIISSIAQTVIRSLLFNQTVKEAVDAPRFHNQFLPHVTEYEHSIPPMIIQNLTKQHLQNMTVIEKQPSVVQALLVMEDGFIHGNSDFRRKTATYPTGY